MPGAHLIALAAQHFGVSADWLLGLSAHREMASDLVNASMQMTAATRALIDNQVYEWHRQATGYKIRHVPTGFPDVLKSHGFLRWEYDRHRNRSTSQAIEDSERRLELIKAAASDLEIAMPRQELEMIARAEGIYRDVPENLRREQLDHLSQVTEQLYPALRLYLFDARTLFSTPLTVFGPLMAAVYIGQSYLVFRDRERVARLSSHFDELVRQAESGSRDLPRIIGRMG